MIPAKDNMMAPYNRETQEHILTEYEEIMKEKKIE